MRDVQPGPLTRTLTRVARIVGVVGVALEMGVEGDSVMRRMLAVTFVPVGPNLTVAMKMSEWRRS